MNIDPSYHNIPAREPVFNLPGSVILVLVVLGLIHGYLSLLPEDEAYGIFLTFGFIPAEMTAFWQGINLPQDAVSPLVTIITYAFLHGDWQHLLFNGLWLMVFGTPVARRWDGAGFLLMGFIASIMGALAHLWLDPSSLSPLIGASAAVSGWTGAALRFMFQEGAFSSPHHQAFLPAQSMLSVFRNRLSLIFLVFWIVTNVLIGLFAVPLGLSADPIAWMAHLGGFASGFLLFKLFDAYFASDHIKTI